MEQAYRGYLVLLGTAVARTESSSVAPAGKELLIMAKTAGERTHNHYKTVLH